MYRELVASNESYWMLKVHHNGISVGEIVSFRTLDELENEMKEWREVDSKVFFAICAPDTVTPEERARIVAHSDATL